MGLWALLSSLAKLLPAMVGKTCSVMAPRTRAAGPVIRDTTVQDLDAYCLCQIMCRLDQLYPNGYSVDYDQKDLQACSLVCREWLEVSNFVRKTLTLRGSPHIATLPRFPSRFPDIQGVQLVGLKESPNGFNGFSMKDMPLGLMVPGCPKLQYMMLKYCLKVSDGGLATVLEGCKELRILRLLYCGEFTGAAFKGVRCTGLESIELDHCYYLSCEGLKAIGPACPNLSDLSVTLWKENGGGRAPGSEEIASLCPRLAKLAVKTCGVTDTTLQKFAAGCPLLTELSITEEPRITDAGVAALRLRLPRLEMLRLHDNSQLFRGPPSTR